MTGLETHPTKMRNFQDPGRGRELVVLRFRPVYNAGLWRKIQDGSHEPPFPPMMILRFGVRP